MTLPIELDHVVIFTHEDAPEAQALEALGLRGFGGTTRHGNLGTASTSFFFNQHYLELFWIDDELAAQNALAPLGFDLRARLAWRETTASPFGVMFRQRPGASGPAPFPTRQMRAEWMPGEIFVNFAAEVTAEPYYGIVPDALSYPSFKATIAEPAHVPGFKELTGVRIKVRSDILSPIAGLLSTNDLITIERGDSALMELTFDAGRQGKTLDVRPTLPLVLAY